MAPERKQPGRQAHFATAAPGLTPEFIAKRRKKHLDELERSNYAESSTAFAGVEEDEDGGGKSSKGRTRATISDKRNTADGKKKKATMNIRTALLYRKGLSTLIEESGVTSLPPTVSTYLTAVAPPPKEPPRLLCSVCGYWGRYKCRKCGMAYCDLNCQGVHNDTRCERRVV